MSFLIKSSINENRTRSYVCKIDGFILAQASGTTTEVYLKDESLKVVAFYQSASRLILTSNWK